MAYNVDWDSDAPDTDAEARLCDHFDARGMTRVYGRCERTYIGSYRRTFVLDIWAAKDGRLLMRCWSRSLDVDDRCYEIIGLDAGAVRAGARDENGGFHDSWLPKAVREAHEDWVDEEY